MKNKELMLYICSAVLALIVSSIVSFYPYRAEIKEWWVLSIIVFVIGLLLIKTSFESLFLKMQLNYFFKNMLTNVIDYAIICM